jgi:type IV secretory pathway VirB4 component
MDECEEFISFKKLIIFGSKGSGKTTLIKLLEDNVYTFEEMTENSKFIFL